MSRKVKRKGKKKSPAHVSQKRLLGETHVYLMHNAPYIWKSKFGITDHTDNRRRDVDETTDGAVFYLMPPCQIPFGYQAEGFVHSVYAWANAPFKEGSGRSEWFVNVNPIVGSAVFYLSVTFHFPLPWWGWLLVFISPVIWLDGLLWLLFFVVFWWLVGIAGIYVAYHFLIA